MKLFNGFGNLIVLGDGIHYVYLYLDSRPNKNNEPFYVGKGKYNRCYFHLKENENNTKNYLKHSKIKAIQKEGYNPKIIKVISNVSERRALDVEQFIIDSFGTIKKKNGSLTNMVTEGWKRLYGTRDDAYRKISEAQKKNWKDPNSIYNDPEFRKRFFRDVRGNKNPNYGNRWSDKQKKHMSEYRKGRAIGSDNPNAKIWKLISPEGIVYDINGSVKNKCDELNIFMSTLKKHINEKVPKPKIIHSRYKEKTLNTIGWCLKLIERKEYNEDYSHEQWQNKTC